MNFKQLARYDNEKKSTKVAYVLGLISWWIPLGLHKFYLGHQTTAVLYLSFGFLTMYAMITASQILLACMTFLSIPYSISMAVDGITTRDYVKKYNSNLMDTIGGGE